MAPLALTVALAGFPWAAIAALRALASWRQASIEYRELRRFHAMQHALRRR